MSGSIGELVPDATHRMEEPRRTTVLLEVFSEIEYEVVDRPCGGEHLVAPNDLQYPLSRHHLVPVRDEHFQQHRLLTSAEN